MTPSVLGKSVRGLKTFLFFINILYYIYFYIEPISSQGNFFTVVFTLNPYCQAVTGWYQLYFLSDEGGCIIHYIAKNVRNWSETNLFVLFLNWFCWLVLLSTHVWLWVMWSRAKITSLGCPPTCYLTSS